MPNKPPPEPAALPQARREVTARQTLEALPASARAVLEARFKSLEILTN